MSDFEGAVKIFDDETAKELGLKKDEYATEFVISVKAVCPDCGAKLVPESGCIYCPICGWSKCK